MKKKSRKPPRYSAAQLHRIVARQKMTINTMRHALDSAQNRVGQLEMQAPTKTRLLNFLDSLRHFREDISAFELHVAQLRK